MDQIPAGLANSLKDLPLAGIHFFNSIGSTNDHGLEWAETGAPDCSLVVADHQSAGRGRADRRWVTNPGAALAFSLVLRPQPAELDRLAFFSPLGALAIRAALDEQHQLPAEVKWPNDVLVRRRKLAGILVENAWLGSTLQAVVIGIGINITPAALPADSPFLFPATCVESETGSPVDRWQLLAEVLNGILARRSSLGSPAFFSEWSQHLAFRGETVCISGALREDLVGRLDGIDAEGRLVLETPDGRQEHVSVGDVRLRAV